MNIIDVLRVVGLGVAIVGLVWAIWALYDAALDLYEVAKYRLNGGRRRYKVVRSNLFREIARACVQTWNLTILVSLMVAFESDVLLSFPHARLIVLSQFLFTAEIVLVCALSINDRLLRHELDKTYVEPESSGEGN